MKLTGSSHKNNSGGSGWRCFGLVLILIVWYGAAQADKPLLIATPDQHANVQRAAIDIKTPLADSFVFTSDKQHPRIQRIGLAAVPTLYASNSYITELTGWHSDKTLVASSFQKPETITNEPLRMITDSVKQRNYLVVGAKVSAPLINGVYAYLAYHRADNTPRDSSRLLSLGGRLEF